jgi:hypothetical protein
LLPKGGGGQQVNDQLRLAIFVPCLKERVQWTSFQESHVGFQKEGPRELSTKRQLVRRRYAVMAKRQLQFDDPKLKLYPDTLNFPISWTSKNICMAKSSFGFYFALISCFPTKPPYSSNILLVAPEVEKQCKTCITIHGHGNNLKSWEIVEALFLCFRQ